MQVYLKNFIHSGNKPLLLRDSVHNYVELTPIEKDIIDTQIFQRLRFITQNSTVFYTYPSNSSNRFQHSIGSAFVAGMFIESALQYSDEKMSQKFIDDFINLCSQICRDNSIQYQNYLDSYKSVESIMWITARLILLLHDIGHLPFSHLSEQVVASEDDIVFENNDDQIKWQRSHIKKYYHEFLTALIVLHNEEISSAFEDKENNPPRKLFHELLKIIFVNNDTKFASLNAFRSLMSGEIDADRADYIIRDGRNSGVEFGGYDISRLADFMRIDYDDDKKVFYFLPLEQALSAIETFFLERYKLYKWVIFHHHVAQTDSAFKHALNIIIQCVSSNSYPDVFSKIDLERFHFDKLVENGHYTDDIWMWNILRSIYSDLSKINEESIPTKILVLRKLLECCLFRKKLIPLWKTRREYEDFSRKVFEKQWKEEIDKKYETKTRRNSPEKEDWEYFHGNIGLNLATRFFITYDYESNKDFENEINSGKDDFWILVEPKKFNPIEEEKAKLLTKDGQILNVIDDSDAIKSIKNMWNCDIHLFAFCVPIQSVTISRENARKRFIDGFMNWYHNHISMFPSQKHVMKESEDKTVEQES